MTSIAEVLSSIEAQLQHAAIVPARIEAEVIVMEVLGKNRAWLYAHKGDRLQEDAHARLQDWVDTRLQGVPLAYISGHKEFWGLDFQLNRHCLIPRPETELLVELCLEKLPNKETARILDLGCGSGAVGIAIASERPHWQILCSDISEQALAQAQHNAHRLGIANTHFLHSDWFAAVAPDLRFDAIVSNPPYIREDDPHLQGEIAQEPRLALSSGADGLNAIRILIQQSPLYLHQDGWLLFEHGYDQKAEIQALFEQSASFHPSQCWTDLAGVDRVSGAIHYSLR